VALKPWAPKPPPIVPLLVSFVIVPKFAIPEPPAPPVRPEGRCHGAPSLLGS
jgi:hypothetical protein